MYFADYDCGRRHGKSSIQKGVVVEVDPAMPMAELFILWPSCQAVLTCHHLGQLSSPELVVELFSREQVVTLSSHETADKLFLSEPADKLFLPGPAVSSCHHLRPAVKLPSPCPTNNLDLAPYSTSHSLICQST